MQGPNGADKVKIMFEIWKSCQNLKRSTATAAPKKSPKNICGSAKLVEGCRFFDSGTVVCCTSKQFCGNVYHKVKYNLDIEVYKWVACGWVVYTTRTSQIV